MPALLCIVQLLIPFVLPESPQYLNFKDKNEEVMSAYILFLSILIQGIIVTTDASTWNGVQIHIICVHTHVCSYPTHFFVFFCGGFVPVSIKCIHMHPL